MSPATKPTVALIYDFDGTLIAGSMQEYGFIEAVGEKKEDFWGQVKDFAREHHFDDEVLAYMYFMVAAAREKGVRITRKDFTAMGKDIDFFEGVQEWFGWLEAQWGAHFCLQHYIISSGVQELIEGCAIAAHFEQIYACQFVYDANYGYPIWPARVVNFTTKTQYLFRINKGTDQVEKLNEYQPEETRPIPFSHMLYFGDGYTDIPCMKLVREHGGHVFALYGQAALGTNLRIDAEEGAQKLVSDGRAHIALRADYRAGGPVTSAVGKVLEHLRAKWALAAHLRPQLGSCSTRRLAG